MKKSDKTKLEILEAAYDEFAEEGLKSATMENIATRAQKSKALVYKYFSNKEVLFEAVVLRTMSSYRGGLAKSDDGLVSLVKSWYSDVRNVDERMLKILLQEGFSYTRSDNLIDRNFRSSFAKSQIKNINDNIELDTPECKFNSEELFLAFYFLTVGPKILPQMVSLALDVEEKSEYFERKWSKFLIKLVKQIVSE